MTARDSATGRYIGTAAIQVTADASGLGPELTRQGQAAAKSAGGAITAALGGVLKKGAAAAGVAVAGVLGTALVKGFQRLSSIDQATKKLEGLGHSAGSVKTIMDNALASVKGTAFGLGDAASQAASLVAAGIKPGKDLERTLKLLADTSTIAGTDLADMGLVFGKVAASGKLTGESLMQLQERGVPVLKFLSDSTGKSMEQVQKDISAGKVSFADFQKAMEQGLGGAAMSSGKTFMGALANVKAALGRFGAGLLGGVFAQMPRIFADIVKWIDMFTPAAKRAGDALGAAFGRGYDVVKAVLDLLGGEYNGTLSKALGIEEDSAIIGTIFTIRDAIMDLFAGLTLKDPNAIGAPLEGLVAVGAKIRAVFEKLGPAGPIGLTALALGAVASPIKSIIGLVPGLGGMVGQMGGLGSSVTSLIPGLGSLGGVIKGALLSPMGLATLAVGGLLTAMLTMDDGGAAIAGMIQTMGAKVAEFVTLIAERIPGLVATVLPAIVSVLSQIATTLPSLITVLVNALVGLAPVILRAAITLFTALVGALSQILPPLIQGIIGIVNALVGLLPTLMPTLLNAAVTMLMALVQAATVILPTLIQAAVSLIMALVNLLPTLLPVLLNAAVTLFTALVNALPVILPAVINGVLAVINAVVKMLPTLIPTLIQAAISLFMALVNALPKVLPLVVNGALAVIFAVVKMLPTLIPTLLSAAFQLFMALVKAVPMILSGLLSAFGAVLSSVWKLISDTFTRWRDEGKRKFDEIVGAIGKAWEGLKEAAKTPIKWVIDTVLNNGIIKAFNWLSDKIGGPHIAPISLGFAKGGVVPGYAPGRDTRAAMLSPGEGIMRPEWVRAVGGKKAIERMNRAARMGYGTDAMLAPFGTGGLLEWINDRWENVHNAFDWVMDKASAIYQAVTNPIDYIKNLIGNWKANLPGPAKQIIEYVEAMVSKGIGVAVQKVKDVWNAFTGAFSSSNAASGPTVSPVSGPITANYGRYPSGGAHRGVDFGVPTGTLVKAFRGGSVIESGWNSSGFGYLVRLLHQNGFTSLYGHNMRTLVKVGQKVASGMGIALSDSTGNSTGPHVHFEIQKNGTAVNPWPYLRGQSFDRGGWLPPRSLTLARNGTNRAEPVGFGGGDTYVTVQMTVSIDDLAKIGRLSDFLEMLDRERVRSRQGGAVSA